MNIELANELLDSVDGGSFAQAKELFERHHELNVDKVCDKYGWTPLHYCAHHGDLEMAEYLIVSRNANVEAVGTDGATPLLVAAKKGHLTMCQLLEQKGALLSVKDSYENTPLIHACRNGNLAACQFLMDKEPHLDARNHRGRTAFTCAIMNGNFAVCQLLREKGVNLDIQDNDGKTALHHAAEKSNRSVLCLYLVQEGANINIKDKFGDTALVYICMNGDIDLAKRFCLVGASAPLSNELKFNAWITLERRTAIENYMSRNGLRKTIITLCGVQLLKKHGVRSPFKVFNIDLICKLFAMLGGEDIKN
jgi:ankyrin repeat protein